MQLHLGDRCPHHPHLRHPGPLVGVLSGEGTQGYLEDLQTATELKYCLFTKAIKSPDFRWTHYVKTNVKHSLARMAFPNIFENFRKISLILTLTHYCAAALRPGCPGEDLPPVQREPRPQARWAGQWAGQAGRHQDAPHLGGRVRRHIQRLSNRGVKEPSQRFANWNTCPQRS